MADTYKSNVVQSSYTNDVDVLYGVVRNVSKQIRDVANGEWDSHPASGSLDDYDISAGACSGGLWSGAFPKEVSKGYYIYQIRKRAGATPDFDDDVIAAVKGYWNGTILKVISTADIGRGRL